MNIFGITLTKAALWLFGVAGSLIGFYLTAYLQSTISRRHAANDAYKSAFSDVLLNLRENPDCPLAQIAYRCDPQITAAIDKRRGEVMLWRRKRFERDVALYKESYQEAILYGSVLAMVMSEKAELMQQNRVQFMQAIERLLSHA